MKCMMSSDGANIIRVSDEEASELYHNENWKYIPKSVWKEQVRDQNKEPIYSEDSFNNVMIPKKSNKMSKSAKRHLRKANK